MFQICYYKVCDLTHNLLNYCHVIELDRFDHVEMIDVCFNERKNLRP